MRPDSAGLPFWRWFATVIEDELTPYPGRLSLVMRMVAAATITMLLIMTFRLPQAAIAAYYTLLLSRDSPQTTLRSALTVAGAYIGCACYCMIGVLLFVDEPLTHFLFVAFSLLLSFFIMKVATNYTGAAAFAFTIAVVVPLWDSPAPVNVLVTETLWAASSVSVGLAVTVTVEYVFGLFARRDPLLEGVMDRLAVLSEALGQCCGADVPRAARRRLAMYGTVGVSRLRRLASRPLSTGATFVRRSTVVSLTGRLVDLANAALHFPDRPPPNEEQQMRRLSRRIDAIRKVIGRGRTLEQYKVAEHIPDAALPILAELERTVQLLTLALTQTEEEVAESQDARESDRLFLPDAFTNREHIHFALRGCLAASLCYVFLNAVAWHGLGTSLATCIVTALSSVGSSRQKQILRLSGAAVGGVILGIGSQMLILPMLDSVVGFMVLFVAVTLPAAWIATASARISYFGLQMALAFYLIHLQEFYPQTNLAIGRDRVMGVGLGLAAMWLVFDRLGSRPAAAVMRETFARNLRLLAELAEPWELDPMRIGRLREQIHANFTNVNAQADAVLFEVGPERRKHMAWRNAIRRWQPDLRAVFVMQIALLQYRIGVKSGEIPPQIVTAQRALDETVRIVLEGLAHSFETHSPLPDTSELRRCYANLKTAVDSAYERVPARARGVLSLSSQMVETLVSLCAAFVLNE